MFHDINDNRCPGVVKFWNEVKEGKKFKEFLYQTDGENVHGIGLLFNDDNDYPEVRHLSSYESAIDIINNGLKSRKELKKELNSVDESIIQNKNLLSDDKWWDERTELELERFDTEDVVYCIPDWYNDSKYETGHGSVMVYFKPELFENFKVTLTLEDSLTEKNKSVYNKKQIKRIYSNILNNVKTYESNTILNNLNHKNDGRMFNTSKGRIFIEGGRFYNKYSEIQIHTKNIPIEYIKEIRFTDNYFDIKDTDDEMKNKLIEICKEKNIPIK